ncbi:collagen alpha-1(X) chain-like [Saccostrea echinata]|uniref:collagen alpha-1(X) chain-like n=1 Tax=Saccostrea echinata TaxID=191078 RepID=UPI002A80404F|nr:collagen alpha-1(X) chain-like [Saccostrea echinata]
MPSVIYITFSFILVTILIEGKSITIKNSTIGRIITAQYSKKELRKDILDQVYKETTQIEKKLKSLTKKVSEMEKGDKEREKKKNKPTKSFGFYSYISSDLKNPGGGHTFVFDVVKTNYENGYNERTGVFTVPRNGLYSFTWVTRVQCNDAYTSELYVNKNVVGSTYAFCGYNTVTGNAIVKVSKGDVVFVRTLAGRGMIRSNKHGRSSFSGFRIE